MFGLGRVALTPLPTSINPSTRAVRILQHNTPFHEHYLYTALRAVSLSQKLIRHFVQLLLEDAINDETSRHFV